MTETTASPSLADRRADATRDGIVEAAWTLSRRAGLTGWSQRDLATSVGLKAPTLYAYFDNKQAIYDAMFRAGYEQASAEANTWLPRGVAIDRAAIKQGLRSFFDFCTSDPTRYQLLFQRVVPDFEPSAEAMAASQSFYDQMRTIFETVGVTEQADYDLLTAIFTGLTDQQLSNDPGGDRWRRLVDVAADLFLDHVGVEDGTHGGNS